MTEITPEIMDKNFADLETLHQDLLDEALKAQFEQLSAVQNSYSITPAQFT